MRCVCYYFTWFDIPLLCCLSLSLFISQLAFVRNRLYSKVRLLLLLLPKLIWFFFSFYYFLLSLEPSCHLFLSFCIIFWIWLSSSEMMMIINNGVSKGILGNLSFYKFQINNICGGLVVLCFLSFLFCFHP